MAALPVQPQIPLEITIAVDMECPFSRTNLLEVVPLIKKRFGSRVAITVGQMPLSFHPSAEPAARAVHCGSEQGMKWPVIKELLAQVLPGSSQVTPWVEFFTPFSRKQTHFSLNKFETCFERQETKEAVSKESQRMVQMGATATPTFFIEGQKVDHSDREVLLIKIQEALNSQNKNGALPSKF